LDPIEYYRSILSRNLAAIIINALKPWLKATEASIIQITRIMRYLFDSSLMLDDIQNHSQCATASQLHMKYLEFHRGATPPAIYLSLLSKSPSSFRIKF
jgi:hypothetical protein